MSFPGNKADRFVVREIGVAPGVADADVDDHSQQQVHRHAGNHHQKALPGGFGPEFCVSSCLAFMEKNINK